MVVHSDVWGSARILTTSGFRWFVTFIDDCTRMTWVFPMKHMSEVSTKFNIFHQYVATQFDKKIQTLRSDNGGEYVNHALHNYLQEHDVQFQEGETYFSKGDIEYPLQEENSMFEEDTQDISNIKIVAEILETEINVDKSADNCNQTLHAETESSTPTSDTEVHLATLSPDGLGLPSSTVPHDQLAPEHNQQVTDQSNSI
ncbi:hypothetical protein PS2_018841 [Malus domestica]